MSPTAPQSTVVTVVLGWREPNGHVIEFGQGPGTIAASTPPANLGSGASGSSPEGAAGRGASLVDLFA